MIQLAPVYIRQTGSFFPNDPVGNDEMEDVLGRIGGQPSRARRTILRSNGIQSRHYAIDPETGRMSHTNTQITVEAIRDLVAKSGLDLDRIDCLACGTTTPDQLMPNHALMVHGELGCQPCEVIATSGACLSGLTALKYAAMNIASGGAANAVAAGSELTSAVMRAAHFPRDETPIEKLKEDPVFAFGQDFLRWMLSDGAGALWLSSEPAASGLSLTLDWIEVVSFANELETCMYWGGRKHEDGTFVGWNQAETFADAVESGMMNFTQDARLLGREISRVTVAKGLSTVRERRPMSSDEVDWFLPHYSSNYFREEVHDRLQEIGFPIPYDRWFTNLTEKGNTGAASIYLMLDDLFHSGKLEPGQRILGFVPESARFSVGYLMMTVVEAGS
jgi:3-oxoacyl-[acyl-carrier-protein] synthase-3